MIEAGFEFQAPQTHGQAWQLLRSNPAARLLAGGTDLIPLLKKGLKNPAVLVSLSRIPGLRLIEKRAEGLFIGAMTSLTGLADNQLVKDLCPGLALAALQTASPQIRNQGTLGGNICQDRRCLYFNQTAQWRQSLEPCYKTGGRVCHQQPSSPRCRAIYHSDLAPMLLALEAEVEIFGDQGFSRVPIQEFIFGHINRNGGTKPGVNLISGFIIPPLPPGAWQGFIKHSVRSSLDFPILNVAADCWPLGPDGLPAKVSIWVGAVAPEPVELQQTARLMESQPLAGPDQKQAWAGAAIAEAQTGSRFIKDTGLAPGARKKALGAVGRLIERMHDHLSSTSDR